MPSRALSLGYVLKYPLPSLGQVCYLLLISNQVFLLLALNYRKKSSCFDPLLREKNPVPLIAYKNQLWLSRTLSRPDKTSRPNNNNTAAILGHLTSVLILSMRTKTEIPRFLG